MAHLHKQLKVPLILKRGGVCADCGYNACKEILHVHHIVARKNGGSSDEDNLLVLCPNCHALRHKSMDWKWKTHEEYLDHERERKKLCERDARLSGVRRSSSTSWRHKNLERARAYDREYKRTHRLAIRAYNKEWRKKNPEKVALNNLLNKRVAGGANNVSPS
jgi:hypothetical protein